MGNLRQKYTTEEWDEMVDSTKPGFVEKRIEQAIYEAAKNYAEGKSSNPTFRDTHIRDFTAGAEWMMENIKINFRRVK